MIVGHGFWWGPGWGFLGALLSAAFWILIIVLIVGLIRGRTGDRPGGSTALAVLEERYARGEIERDEFLERRRILLREAQPDTG